MDATDPYDFISTSSSRTSLSSPLLFDCFGNNVEFTMELEAPSFRLPLVVLTDTTPHASRKSAVVSMYSVLAPKDETLYHNNMPVYCVEEKAVGPDDAVRQAYRCPSKYVCKYAPAGLVRENYCFVVDGHSVPLENLVGDEAYWKPTGRPAHYVYTEDLVNFQPVRIMVFRGKIINAKVKTTSNSKGSADKTKKRTKQWGNWQENRIDETMSLRGAAAPVPCTRYCIVFNVRALLSL
uniref:Uncharacterized protein n=1 Tax=Romanomermis culicivorax TaxID=13658 RepID=A0A915KH52_ROMCU